MADVRIGNPVAGVNLDDSTLFAQVTSVAYTGYSQNAEAGYIAHFDGTLTDTEVRRIQELVGYGPEYASMRRAARVAIDANTAWVNNTLPQVINGCDSIINHASSSAFDKDLARGLKTTANQVGELLRQNNAVIRLIIQRDDAARATTGRLSGL